jgi:ABC-type Mn2+/Zn2+ transport system permease subunit
MLYPEQTRSRIIFITATTVATVTLMATVQGINAVGVLLAAAFINIPVYYALPDRHSEAYTQKHQNRVN